MKTTGTRRLSEGLTSVRRAPPTSVLALVIVALAAGDVVIVAWSFGAWPRVADAAMPHNRALADSLSHHEQARCWAVAPEDPSLEDCDVGLQLDEHFVELAAVDVPFTTLVAAADEALRCRCVGVTYGYSRLRRINGLTGQGTNDERVRWRERQLTLIATLATATEIDMLAEAVDAATLDAIATNDVALVRRTRAAIRRVSALVHTEPAKARRLAMAVSRDAMAAANVELGGRSLHGHDRAARALEVSRALDACTTAEGCEVLADLAILNELDRLSVREVIQDFDARARENDALLARRE